MAVRGSYRLTLTTTPQRIDLQGQDNRDGTAFSWRTLTGTANWLIGGPDMTAANGAMPGAVIDAGMWFSADISGDDAWYACVGTGTVELHRLPAGI